MQKINRQPAELGQIVANTGCFGPRFGRRDSSRASSSRAMSTARQLRARVPALEQLRTRQATSYGLSRNQNAP
jgi:hypothetical protein